MTHYFSNGTHKNYTRIIKTVLLCEITYSCLAFSKILFNLKIGTFLPFTVTSSYCFIIIEHLQSTLYIKVQGTLPYCGVLPIEVINKIKYFWSNIMKSENSKTMKDFDYCALLSTLISTRCSISPLTVRRCTSIL